LNGHFPESGYCWPVPFSLQQAGGAPSYIHTAAYWLMLSLRGLAPKTSFWREAQFDTLRLCLIKVAGRVTEMVTRIKIALPSAFPYQAGFADLAGRIAKLPP
jgi:Transposase DDE domain group 1